MIRKHRKSNLKNSENTKQKYTSTQYGNLVKNLEENILLFKNIFANDETLIIRRFQSKYLQAARCCIIYLSGMADNNMINENIIHPILDNNLSEYITGDNLLEELHYKVIASNNISADGYFDSIIHSLVSGNTIFLLDGYDEALVIDAKGWEARPITEPESARVVRGPREGFTESLEMNLTMLRRKIKNPDLKLKFKEIGVRTHTKTCICYIEGLAWKGILEELEQRLDKIDIDAILDSGYIQELIKDAPFSPYETVGSSERPDIIAAKLLEGRIALFVDGSPFVLTVPFIALEYAQSNEDYYNNFIISSINRLFRSITASIANGIPAFFLAIVTFHQEMLPTPLLLSISASREGVPLPTFVSLLVMLLIFDILREVGIRMPAPIGQAVNIVGTLVLGQAAVEARLVSAPVVIITALSGIMTLLNMNLAGPAILQRTFFLLGAAFLGLYGLLLCYILNYLHMMGIRSFGVPYMLNSASLRNHNVQDALIRAPWWTMTLRPKIIGARNLVRQSSNKSKRN